ncbi:hypothetical protein LLY41_14330 [Cytobacillus firmus]|uniref:DUF6731 family protein n=1 Tax=Cytobacillus firmus TaxID=1399 RepID=UPI0021855DCB|nr:DUF6731 family protein [Cytobacillus firmus]URM31595.1 hypothetical protein LLY41_14330 [Cytobacillus firmus]
MARKYVRFNYFEVQLVPAPIALREELVEGYQDIRFNDEDEQDVADVWNMAPFLDYLMTHRDTFDTNVEMGDEYAEIETDSYLYDDRRNLYSFQLSKLRDKNIPSKKRFGEIKEEILLEQDEFIGEFVSVIYDNVYNSVALQSNLYGLSVRQTENVLTQLRFRYLDDTGRADEIPLVVRLAPIIDRSKIQRVIRADYYKKVRIKGSNVMLDAELGEQSMLGDARRLLNEVAGVNIDLTISLGRAERTASLNDLRIRELIEVYTELPEEHRPQIELTALENEEAEIETINLLEPRMTDRITIEIAPRTTVAHEYLCNTFLETAYDQRRPDIRRVLMPIGPE